jgi:hypothetical protein
VTQVSIDLSILVPATAAVISSVITGICTFLAARHRNVSEEHHVEHDVDQHQALLNSSFNALVDQLQEERGSFLKIIEEQGFQIKTHLEAIRQLTLSLDEARIRLALNGIAYEPGE